MALLNSGRNFVLSKNDGQESTVCKDKDHSWPYRTVEEILFSRRIMARKVLYIKSRPYWTVEEFLFFQRMMARKVLYVIYKDHMWPYWTLAIFVLKKFLQSKNCFINLLHDMWQMLHFIFLKNDGQYVKYKDHMWLYWTLAIFNFKKFHQFVSWHVTNVTFYHLHMPCYTLHDELNEMVVEYIG